MNNTSNNTYKNIFFDLDRTLWDYDANSEQTLFELIQRYIPELKPRFKEFLTVFYEINEDLWLKYRDGQIKKSFLQSTRFVDTFQKLSVNAAHFVVQFGEDYIKNAPYQSNLFPNAIETLAYLKMKGYRMFLLTNGFVEVQKVKVRESKLDTFFERLITSEEAGFQKPDPGIFDYALTEINATAHECIMVGDDLDNDIYGATRVGMDAVFFNPKNLKHTSKPKYEIVDLAQLMKIF